MCVRIRPQAARLWCLTCFKASSLADQRLLVLAHGGFLCSTTEIGHDVLSSQSFVHDAFLQEDMVMFVQKLPTASWEVKDVEAILSQAYIYQTAFQAAPSHLG